MNKILATLITGATLGLSPVTHAALDWWWTPAKNGMGYAIGQIGDAVFLTWFHYEPDGSPGFLMLSGRLQNNALAGPLFRTDGPPPGPNFNPVAVRFMEVGGARLEFDANDYNRATFMYEYNGVRETVPLQRFTYGDIAEKLGTRAAPRLYRGLVHDPADYQNRGNTFFTFSIGTAADGPPAFELKAETINSTNSMTCVYQGTYVPVSNYLNASGTFRCGEALSGTFRAERLTVTEDGLYSGTFYRTANNVTTLMPHTGLFLREE